MAEHTPGLCAIIGVCTSVRVAAGKARYVDGHAAFGATLAAYKSGDSATPRRHENSSNAWRGKHEPSGRPNTTPAEGESEAERGMQRPTDAALNGCSAETLHEATSSPSTRRQRAGATTAISQFGLGSARTIQGGSIMSNHEPLEESTQQQTSSSAAEPATSASGSPTPGPWHIGQHDTEFVIYAGPRPLCIEAGGSGDEAEANAHLIAAAPALLEALEARDAALAPYSDGLRRSHLTMNSVEQRIYEKHLEARAAIAQARGEHARA